MAKFSPTFSIDITDNFAAGNTCTVTNPGQAFELIDLVCSGTALAVITVKKNTSGGNLAATANIVAGSTVTGSVAQIVDTDSSFAATDNIFITVTTQPVTRVTLICRSAVAATWTNTPPA